MSRQAIPAEIIRRAAQGDLEALTELDRRGLTPADGEDATAFAHRLETLNENIRKMEDELTQKGSYSIDDISLQKESRIPKEIFRTPGEWTRKLYGFSCDWVPGFFLDPNFSGLFGGCAYSFYPDFFALFIIRHSFKQKKKWLWYHRDELLAHELCHVARIACESTVFEELMAYQTATSPFRRWIGGIFRSQVDVFLFLGSALLQLLLQVVRTFWVPAIPGWLGMTIMAAVVLFLLFRYGRDLHHHNLALKKLTALYQGEAATARAVLFHGNDQEIRAMATSKDLPALLEEFSKKSLRWQILRHRFPWSVGNP